MKLHQAIHAGLGISIAFTAISSQALFAGPGDPFNGIDTSLRNKSQNVAVLPDGSLDYGACPVGYTCSSSPVADTGFIQMTLTNNATGQNIIHTIVAEGDSGSSLGAPGDDFFGSSSFVLMGTNQTSSFAGEQVINDNNGVESYTSRVASVTGVFANTVNPTLKINQDMTVDNGKYVSGFELASGINDLAQLGYDGTYTEMSLSGSIVENNGVFTSDFMYQRLTNSDVTTGQTLADAAEFSKQRLTSSLDETGTVPDPFVQDFFFDRRTGAAVLDDGTAFAPTTNLISFNAGSDIGLIKISEAAGDGGDFTFEKFIEHSIDATADYQAFNDVTDQVEVSYNDTSLGNPFETF